MKMRVTPAAATGRKPLPPPRPPGHHASEPEVQRLGRLGLRLTAHFAGVSRERLALARPLGR